MRPLGVIVVLTFSLLIVNDLIAQQDTLSVDSIRRQLKKEIVNNPHDDTLKVNALNLLGNGYWLTRYDSGLYYAKQALLLSRQLDYKKGEVNALTTMGLAYDVLGARAKAFDYLREALTQAEKVGVDTLIGFVMTAYVDNFLGYNGGRNYVESLDLSRKAFQLNKNDPLLQAINLTQVAGSFMGLNQPDSALAYAKQAFAKVQTTNWELPYATILLGQAYGKLGDSKNARYYFKYSANISLKLREYPNACWSNILLSKVFSDLGLADSTMYYSNLALEQALQSGSLRTLVDASENLSQNYANISNYEKAFYYSQLTIHYDDSLKKLVLEQSIEDQLGIEQTLKDFENERTASAYESKVTRIVLIAILVFAAVIILVIFREVRIQKKSKKLIEQAYLQLKATQSQLIHSEKMASLGELTAGIAHEIQNPLNFVNNFSEVNKELIEDLKDAILKNDQEEVNTLLSDLLENEDKVVHHGKRAEEIVRSMLLHSRGSDGKKELTDINALCDEYMRLSYHGLRAKDQTFNADFDLDLEPNLPKIEVVPQDIGRVLLNLINNAFQAVAEVENPKVTLITQFLNNSITIRVADNGPGIPDQIRDKIFQPFFTTKPTGQGTGLGLSMSYDIVRKGHGGKLEVESGSESGKGTEFIVKIPIA